MKHRSNYLPRDLQTAQREGRFSEFLRKPQSCESVTGYVLRYSADCVLISLLNWDSFSWAGRSIIWVRDLKRVNVFSDSEWPIIAARKLGIAKAVSCSFVDESVHTFVGGSVGEGDLIQIEQEKTHPGEMFLCEVCQINAIGIQVRSYDRYLRDSTELEMQYRDITKITFVDPYSAAAATFLKGKKMQGVWQRDPKADVTRPAKK